MSQQPPTNDNDQSGRLALPETGAVAAQNPWLASFLLRQVRRICDLKYQLRLYAYWLWVRGQTGGVRAYHRLKAMRPGKRLIGTTVTGAALLLASAAPVLAGTITVNSATDDGSGCTLREAIVAANTDAVYGGCSGAAGNDVIDLTGISGTITLTGTLPVITETVQLNGPGAGSLTIDGGNSFNALEGTGAGTSIGVDRLTVTNVISDGIYARDSLTVTNSVITGSDCGAYAYDGAAVISSSTITGQGCYGVAAYSSAAITDSLVTGAGDGVFVFDGPATVTDSTVTGNGYGMLSFGDALVTNSVITGTTANGVDSYANVTVISSTVTGGYNGAYSYTGSVMVDSSTVTGSNNGVFSYTGNAVVDSSTITGITDDGVDANVGYAHVSNSRVVGGEAGVDTDTGAIVVSSSTIIGAGPGIDATGSATVISSTITGSSGNGISSSTADASVSYSTVTGALTGVVAPFNITIESSTISGSGQHGVQSLTGQITINHSTIANNGGNGIVNNAGTTVLHHTIVAQNAQSGTTRDINGTLDASSSYNLIGNGDGAGISNGTNGNLVGSTGAVLDPLLGALQNNGGTTATHLPDPDSPAIDAGDPSFSDPPDFDQRGSGFPRIVDTVDIGAVEATDKVIKIRLPIIFKDG